MPAAAARLPSIFLGEMPRPERKLPPVYLCKSGPDGASGRLKWLASTCLAGMVSVYLIGVAIYASLNMGDGSGMMQGGSIHRRPARCSRCAPPPSPRTGKRGRPERRPHPDDRRRLHHPPSHPRHGDRAAGQPRIHHHQEPYLRIVAGLATELPADADEAPPLQSLQALFRPDAGRRRRPGRGRAASRQRHRGRHAGRAAAAVGRGRAQAGRGRPAGRRGGGDRHCRGCRRHDGDGEGQLLQAAFIRKTASAPLPRRTRR